MKAAQPPGIKEFIRKAYILQLREGPFSGSSLARETGMSYGYASSMLGRLLGLGYVRRTREKALLGSGGRSCLRGFSPAGYALTARGRRRIRVVLTGGVFDILHPGHLSILTESKGHGDVLVAVVARDSTVRKRKGRGPVLGEEARLSVVSSLRPVDAAILGSGHSFAETLERVRPDLVFLGHDQHDDESYLKRFMKRTGVRIKTARSRSMLPEYSTSSMLRGIKGR
jgi:cytidyltransferase-like protein